MKKCWFWDVSVYFQKGPCASLGDGIAVGLETLATSPKRARGASICKLSKLSKVMICIATVATVAVSLSGNCWLSWRREQETIWIHFLHCFDFDMERESRANCIKTSNKYASIHNIVQTYTEWHIKWQRQSKNAQWQNAATSLHRPEWRMTPVTPIPIQSFQSFQEASPTTRLWQRQGKKGGFRVGFPVCSTSQRLFVRSLRSWKPYERCGHPRSGWHCEDTQEHKVTQIYSNMSNSKDLCQDLKKNHCFHGTLKNFGFCALTLKEIRRFVLWL